MTYKSLTIPAILLITGAFVAGACTLGTIDDEGFGGLGGEGGDASASGGASTGGTAATGGAGGAGGEVTLVDCQADGTALGDLASTDPVATDDPCTACQKTVCADEFAVCNAGDPETACRYGTTTYDGTEGPLQLDGEWDCIDACLIDTQLYDPEGIAACAAECGSLECNGSAAGSVAFDLATCIVVGNGSDDCFDACDYL